MRPKKKIGRFSPALEGRNSCDLKKPIKSPRWFFRAESSGPAFFSTFGGMLRVRRLFFAGPVFCDCFPFKQGDVNRWAGVLGRPHVPWQSFGGTMKKPLLSFAIRSGEAVGADSWIPVDLSAGAGRRPKAILRRKDTMQT